MRSRSSTGAILSSIIIFLPLITSTGAHAAQTLAQVQAQVNRLEDEATTAAEGAQEAKVQLAALRSEEHTSETPVTDQSRMPSSA